MHICVYEMLYNYFVHRVGNHDLKLGKAYWTDCGCYIGINCNAGVRAYIQFKKGKINGLIISNAVSGIWDYFLGNNQQIKEQNGLMLEPGGIDHSESSRNNQSKLIRNSQTSWLRTPALT